METLLVPKLHSVRGWLVISNFRRLRDQDCDRDQLGEAKILDSHVGVSLSLSPLSHPQTVTVLRYISCMA